MIKRKTWESFRNSGLLWFVNLQLQVFGWSIVYDFKDGEIGDVYPARTKFRGFSEKANEQGYIAVSEFMNENSEELLDEAKEN